MDFYVDLTRSDPCRNEIVDCSRISFLRVLGQPTWQALYGTVPSSEGSALSWWLRNAMRHRTSGIMMPYPRSKSGGPASLSLSILLVPRFTVHFSCRQSQSQTYENISNTQHHAETKSLQTTRATNQELQSHRLNLDEL